MPKISIPADRLVKKTEKAALLKVGRFQSWFPLKLVQRESDEVTIVLYVPDAFEFKLRRTDPTNYKNIIEERVCYLSELGQFDPAFVEGNNQAPAFDFDQTSDVDRLAGARAELFTRLVSTNLNPDQDPEIAEVLAGILEGLRR